MSSGPVGLDAREYVYGLYVVTTPDTTTRFYSTRNAWLITRIQAFTPSTTPAFLGLAGQTIPIFVGGCVDLEPNGGYRGEVSFGSNSAPGAVLIIEYWYQALAHGNPPIVQVT